MTVFVCNECGEEYVNPRNARCRLPTCPSCGAPKTKHSKKG